MQRHAGSLSPGGFFCPVASSEGELVKDVGVRSGDDLVGSEASQGLRGGPQGFVRGGVVEDAKGARKIVLSVAVFANAVR